MASQIQLLRQEAAALKVENGELQQRELAARSFMQVGWCWYGCWGTSMCRNR